MAQLSVRPCEKITLKHQLPECDGLGGYVLKYNEKTVWASTKMTTTGANMVFMIRSKEETNPQQVFWRGTLYNVLAVQPNSHQRGVKNLVCRRPKC